MSKKEFDKDQILNAFFANDAKSVKYDAVNDSYKFKDFTFNTREWSVNIHASGKDLCPYRDNIIRNSEKANCKITMKEAVDLCEAFLKKLNLSNFRKDYGIAYGTQGRTPYYQIGFIQTQDNLSITSVGRYSYFLFSVSDDGICKITGNLLDLQKIKSVKSIISLDQALSIAEKELPKIVIGTDYGYDLEKYPTQNDQLTTIPVCQIEFQYVAIVQEKATVSPCWRLLIGDSPKNIDRTKSITIDAVTGDVIS